MAALQQNFSVVAGDDKELDFHINPGALGVSLGGASITFSAYQQDGGNPSGPAVLTKAVAGGITITNPTAQDFKLLLSSADTLQLAGNYYFKVFVVDIDGNNTTVTVGIMTVTVTPVTPTVAVMQLRFPEFVTAPDALIQFALDEAKLFMGNWTKKGRIQAQMYLAAHILSTNAFAADTGGQDVSAETIGRISIHYRNNPKQIMGDINSTMYGRRYQQLQGMNTPTMLTIRTSHRINGYLPSSER